MLFQTLDPRLRLSILVLLLGLATTPVQGQDHSVDLLGEASGKVDAGGPAQVSPPDPETAATVASELQELYPDLFGRTRNPGQTRWRAFELAKASSEEPTARWVLLERAIGLAIDESNPFAVIDILAYRQRSFDTGTALADEQRRRLAEMRADPVRDALLALTTDPDDPVAHGVIGRELCFQQRAWSRGLPYLVRGDDAQLSELAQRDLAVSGLDPGAAEAIAGHVAVGNAWYDHAGSIRDRDQRPALYWRAGHHYRLVRFRSEGIDRRRIEQRLEDKNILRSGQPLDLFPYLTLEGDKFQGRWSGEGGVLRVARNETGDHLTLPLSPRGDYLLEVEFSVQSNTGEAMFILPVEDTSLCSFVYHRPLSVHRIDNDYIRAQNDDALVRRRKRQFYRAEISPSSGILDIAIALDGEPALQWQGPMSEHAFGPHPRATPRFLGVLGLGAWDAEVHFYRAAVTMLSGEMEQVDLRR